MNQAKYFWSGECD